MKISAIIPAYNIKAYIAEALESVLRQDPPFYEIIIIDDGSTDGTEKILSTFRDPRIRYYRQQNYGLGPARNRGLDFANGDFIYFIDGDDVLESGMTKILQKHINTLSKPVDAILFSATDFSHETGEVCSSSSYFERKNLGAFENGKEVLFSALKEKSMPSPVWLYIFRKSILELNPPLRFLNILHEDEVFTPDLLLRCGSTIVTNERLYKHRVRAGSIMTSAINERNVSGILLAAQRWLDRCRHVSREESELYTRQAHYFYCRAMRTAGHGKLGFSHTKKLIEQFAPGFIRYFFFDFCLGQISKRAAFEYGIIRSRFIKLKA